MFDYLNGVIAEIREDYIVIDIGSIGYKIFSSANTISDLKVTNKVKLFTHLHVKEDDLVLYGFYCRNELELFKLLMSVSGIGPKAAISLLSCLKPNELVLAIGTQNIKALTQAPGVGKKTAERIILELRDKININADVMMDVNEVSSTNMAEVIDALMSLDYSYNEASLAFSKIQNKEKPIDSLIKEALKQLSRI